MTTAGRWISGVFIDAQGQPNVTPDRARAALALADSLVNAIANARYEATRQPARATEFAATADRYARLRAGLIEQLGALGYTVR